MQLSEVLSGRNPIVGAVFNSDFLEQANEKKIASAKFILIKNLTRELQEASFDYRPSEGAIDFSIVANHNPAAEIFNCVITALSKMTVTHSPCLNKAVLSPSWSLPFPQFTAAYAAYANGACFGK